jgi:hypothetical protein
VDNAEPGICAQDASVEASIQRMVGDHHRWTACELPMYVWQIPGRFSKTYLGQIVPLESSVEEARARGLFLKIMSKKPVDIVLSLLDGYGILVADRGDLAGYLDYGDHACCARKAVHGAMPGTAWTYAGGRGSVPL